MRGPHPTTSLPCHCGTPRPPRTTRTWQGTPDQVAAVVLALLQGTNSIQTLKETR